LARKVGAREGIGADGLKRGGLGEVEFLEIGFTKGVVADRDDGGPHLEGAGELFVLLEGLAADGLERGRVGEVETHEVGLVKGQGADRGDGGPHLEGAGEPVVFVEGLVADVLELE